MRLVISPLLLPYLIIVSASKQNALLNIIVAVIFVLLAITDFLDGFFARRYQLSTALGALLDPLADKFLLCAVLVALVATQKIWFLWALIFLLREFIVMGVRSMALECGFSVPVSWAGKIKTVAQYSYLTIVLLNTGNHNYIRHIDMVESVLLCFSVIITIVSGYWYCASFINQLKKGKQ
ncbi:MAG: CDP-diacylglycerol--glycerol-3-phosphate 3-phosphatidyltransferase [Candidatus Dependentiae bacterium ADurb.Bin331]|nr:MAG: CDP-diacylglycerol--glycerol-3-phosphate 3-phosphatidyltransferase [Candidatus Dependentiae bacterium ADurb.Bin331]